MREFLVTLRIKTEEGSPSKWDWQELIDDDVELVNFEEVNKVIKIKLSGITWDTNEEKLNLPTELVVELDNPDDDDLIFQKAIEKATDMIGFRIMSSLIDYWYEMIQENQEIIG